MAARLRERFNKVILPELTREFGYKNPMRVPRLKKVVVNTTSKEFPKDQKLFEKACQEVAAITGQRPKITRAKKAIANFKLREDVPLGAMVTLRKDQMYEFVDRLLNVALPRVRDFKGVSPRAFDGRGNYTLGIREQIIFPEIEIENVSRIGGLNVTFATSAKTDEEGRALLKKLGMPFRK